MIVMSFWMERSEMKNLPPNVRSHKIPRIRFGMTDVAVLYGAMSFWGGSTPKNPAKQCALYEISHFRSRWQTCHSDDRREEDSPATRYCPRQSLSCWAYAKHLSTQESSERFGQADFLRHSIKWKFVFSLCTRLLENSSSGLRLHSEWDICHAGR